MLTFQWDSQNIDSQNEFEAYTCKITTASLGNQLSYKP